MSKNRIKGTAQDFTSIQLALEESKILIVDDLPANLDLLRKTLESKAYNISVAPSSEVALSIVRRAVPDLILLDVMMPGMDGFETCRRLKSNPTTADIPVILLTAKDEPDSVLEGFHVGDRNGNGVAFLEFRCH
jgi:CheY-like chemotaxis protein